MSAIMLCGDAMLRLSSARVARDDVMALTDSAALLAETKALKENAALAAAEAERHGFERGREQALEEMRTVMSEALSQLSGDFAAENARREREVAGAAMHVIEQVLGNMDQADVIKRVARQASRGAGSGQVHLYVAPEWFDVVSVTFSDSPDTVVEADASVPHMGCRVVSGEGRIIADLETQLAALRTRWGLDGRDTSSASSGMTDG